MDTEPDFSRRGNGSFVLLLYYRNGTEELGWQVLEDFDRELADIVPDAKDLLFELALSGERISLSKLRGVIQGKVGEEALVETVIDI